jgi:hypothetical protein
MEEFDGFENLLDNMRGLDFVEEAKISVQVPLRSIFKHQDNVVLDVEHIVQVNYRRM